MRKSILALSIASSLIGTAYAGTMGPVSSVVPGYTPFASAEGSYTWNSFLTSGPGLVTSQNGWGGRLAVGVNRPWKDNLGLTFETGYGYYGNISGTYAQSGGGPLGNGTVNASAKTDVLGADILAGLFYTYNQFDVFAKAGMMVQTLWQKGTLNSSLNMLSLVTVDTNATMRANETAVLPEIKVGGDYNINDAMGLSLAYMHVFGSRNNGATVTTPVGAFSPITANVNTQAVTMDAIMFGIHYNFV